MVELWGLFLSSFISSTLTLLLGGSELLLLYLAGQGGVHDSLLLWGIATLGNSLDGTTSWGVGLLLAWRFLFSGLSRKTPSCSGAHASSGAARPAALGD